MRAALAIFALLTFAPSAAAAPNVEIRRTSHGIPHIKAVTFHGAAYGYGYAFAQDNLCEIAETALLAQVSAANATEAARIAPADPERSFVGQTRCAAAGASCAASPGATAPPAARSRSASGQARPAAAPTA